MNAVREELSYSKVLASLDLTNLPRHIAVIMDGNGRWASKRDLPRIEGHKEGVAAIRRAIEVCLDLGIPFLSLFCFSKENWRRPAEEVAELFNLFHKTAISEQDELHRKEIKVILTGSISDLPKPLRQCFKELAGLTRKNNRMVLNLAVNYSGRQEIVDAVRSIAMSIVRGEVSPESIDEELISKNLYFSDMPDPDLLIRTSGEIRISNFLLWQIAYSEIYISELLWPDIRKEDIISAILDYQKRARRFGR